VGRSRRWAAAGTWARRLAAGDGRMALGCFQPSSALRRQLVGWTRFCCGRRAGASTRNPGPAAIRAAGGDGPQFRDKRCAQLRRVLFVCSGWVRPKTRGGSAAVLQGWAAAEVTKPRDGVTLRTGGSPRQRQMPATGRWKLGLALYREFAGKLGTWKGGL